MLMERSQWIKDDDGYDDDECVKELFEQHSCAQVERHCSRNEEGSKLDTGTGR